MTGSVHLTPEAERQLNKLDDWITASASADVARRFVTALLEHIDGIEFKTSELDRTVFSQAIVELSLS